MLYRVTAPHFVAGFEVGKYRSVVRAAPIISYMETWTLELVCAYCERKGWKVEKVNGEEEGK